jgi:hypothetical protein
MTILPPAVRGENIIVIAGSANHWTHASAINRNAPHVKIMSATSLDASSPPAARANGINIAAVPCIPRWHTTPRLYICIVMPPAAQQHGKSSLGGGMNSLDHCMLYQLATHGAEASSTMDVAAAAPEGPNPFDRNNGTTHHNNGDNDNDGDSIVVLPLSSPKMKRGSRARFRRFVVRDTLRGVTVFSSP